MTTGQTTGENEENGADAKSAGRLFLAVPVDDRTRDRLAQFLAPIALPGRRVPPDKWHLTLRFLGDTSHERLQRLRDQLHAASLGSSFEMAFDGLGAFPRPVRASVLWLGISEGAHQLGTLAAVVEVVVRRAGFAAKSRPFASHLTLSRLQPPRDIRATIEAVPAFREIMAVNDVILLRSHLGRGPSRYEVVDTFTLSAGEAGGSA
jgi:RNA 2',3'-cyclic 3'-phosphodiesterase